MKIELVNIHFWILHIIFTVSIIAGFLYRISIVLQGSVVEFGYISPGRMNRWGKFGYFNSKFFRTLFSRQSGTIMRAIFSDSIVHKKLFRENRLKWVAHTCVFWGVLALFVLSLLSGIAVDAAPAFGYNVGTSAFLDGLANKDHAVTALLNEILNTVIFIGIIIALVRGFASKRKIGMMMFQDIFLIIFILIILVSGWFTESLRYIIERTPENIARLGYGGFYLGRLLSGIFYAAPENAWIAGYKVSWHVHVSVIWLAFIYLPFSKFAHALFSPVASVINVMEKKKTKNEYR
ncbi:MAG: respiratory nitrate reductase subunit gamma [Actinobacteria bacterium]|nr:respiratory nitrate reductase subunit gamma [Actinomycetota bacterium]